MYFKGIIGKKCNLFFLIIQVPYYERSSDPNINLCPENTHLLLRLKDEAAIICIFVIANKLKKQTNMLVCLSKLSDLPILSVALSSKLISPYRKCEWKAEILQNGQHLPHQR